MGFSQLYLMFDLWQSYLQERCSQSYTSEVLKLWRSPLYGV